MRPSKARVALVAFLIAGPPPCALRAEAPADTPAATREPVVVDLVVRDKKGNPVPDLKAEEIELLEDGAKQSFEAFHRVGGEAAASADASTPPRLVVLLFPRLLRADSDLARSGAEDFLKKAGSGLSVAVLNVGPELVPVQEFSTDPAVLKDAVKRATDSAAKAGEPSLQSLFSLVQWLKGQPGRKTAVLFAAGIVVPPGFEDSVETLAGLANRNRVSFYGVDPHGMEVVSKTGMQLGQQPGAAPGELQIGAMGGGSRIGEDLQGWGRNFSAPSGQSTQALERLAGATGGFTAERSNNLAPALRRVAEDARSYYELSYAPSSSKAEGEFRKLDVRVTRDGAKTQARQPYLVGDVASPVATYEKRLASALAADPLPQDVPAFDRVLRFDYDGKELTHVLWLTVPLAKVSLAEDAKAGRFKGNVAVLARVKDASGKVVDTFSRSFPLEGPLDQAAHAHGQSIPFVRRFKLAPGDYTLETAVWDAGADKTTARRTAFKVQPPQGIGISSLSLADVLPAGTDADSDDPLLLGKQRLVPNVGQPIKAGQPSMTLYSVVYPVPRSKDPANMTITVLLGGQTVNNATATLPAPDAKGRIPYTTALRMDVLPPGNYLFKVAVNQGSWRAEESMTFTIVP
jgi:VWFA-related protein